MTGFRILLLAASLALLALISYRRFRAGVVLEKQAFFPIFRAYLIWAARGLAVVFKPEGWKKIRSFFLAWIERYTQTWQKWVLGGAWLSFSYLAASGFGFALFSSRGLYGLPLFLHVLGGGLFILCLALLVILRAKDYLPILPDQNHSERPNALWRNFPASVPRPILFWLLVISGFSLALTALLSMLPYFAYEDQLDIIAAHRYSSLAALVSAVLFLDQAFPPSGRQD